MAAGGLPPHETTNSWNMMGEGGAWRIILGANKNALN